MEIVEIWQNLEKMATEIMIFLHHYMWVENSKNQYLFQINYKYQWLSKKFSM